MDDFHDGVNYMRTACVIAVSRAKDMFEPFVHQVPLPPLCSHELAKFNTFSCLHTSRESASMLSITGRGMRCSSRLGLQRFQQAVICAWHALQLGYRFSHVLRRMLPIAMHLLGKDGEGLTGHDLFLKRLGASFHSFVEEVESATRARCTSGTPLPPLLYPSCPYLALNKGFLP